MMIHGIAATSKTTDITDTVRLDRRISAAQPTNGDANTNKGKSKRQCQGCHLKQVQKSMNPSTIANAYNEDTLDSCAVRSNVSKSIKAKIAT
jgi:hypothetical protein